MVLVFERRKNGNKFGKCEEKIERQKTDGEKAREKRKGIKEQEQVARKHHGVSGTLALQ